MTLLGRQPSEPNLALLFELLRTLTLYPDLERGVALCIQKVAEAFPRLNIMAGLEDSDSSRIGKIFGEPPEFFQRFKPNPVRMGSFPLGMALGSDGDYIGNNGQFPFIYESAIKYENRLAAIVSLSLASPPDPEERETICNLGQWLSRIIQEAIALRKALLEQTDRCEEELKSLTSVTPLVRPADEKPAEPLSFHGIIGSSSAMKDVYTMISQVAPTDALVLITGESGTGKELVAKAVHECSRQSAGPFIAVNCAALPESIIESELFGHEKGSFTGATAPRQGRFELAQDGTLFLDEIGDLSPNVQVKLLRVLQERTFERVGGNRQIKTNARIIAATNKDLPREVQEGRFRQDLFFRLNIFPIHLPPLRERGADILLLADHFAALAATTTGKRIARISSPALDLLMIYHWPGNVRELENCIARAAILSTDGVIHSYHLPPSLQSAQSTGTEPASSLDSALARLERELLVEALKIERGNAAAAARRLGVTERRFRLAMDRFRLDYRAFRTKM